MCQNWFCFIISWLVLSSRVLFCFRFHHVLKLVLAEVAHIVALGARFCRWVFYLHVAMLWFIEIWRQDRGSAPWCVSVIFQWIFFENSGHINDALLEHAIGTCGTTMEDLWDAGLSQTTCHGSCSDSRVGCHQGHQGHMVKPELAQWYHLHLLLVDVGSIFRLL